MRNIFRLTLGAAFALYACVSVDNREPVAPDDRLLLGHAPTPCIPDIIVDQPTLAHSWVIYDETLSPTACDVIEGDVPAGNHRLLQRPDPFYRGRKLNEKVKSHPSRLFITGCLRLAERCFRNAGWCSSSRGV